MLHPAAHRCRIRPTDPSHRFCQRLVTRTSVINEQRARDRCPNTPDPFSCIVPIVTTGKGSRQIGGRLEGHAHAHSGRHTVSDANEPVRIELTDEQKAQIKDATGKEASAIELSAEELEERTMPRKTMPRKTMPRKQF